MQRALAVLSLSLAIVACADYQFTVNDRVVYTPEPLFDQFDIPDAALRGCVEQHIMDGGIKSVTQFTEFNCSHAGIADLAGLEAFTALQRVQLANNAISSLAPLAGLAQLSSVNLANNQLKSLLPLRGLEKLNFLNVSGNTILVCGELRYFQQLPALILEIPEHCSDPAA